MGKRIDDNAWCLSSPSVNSKETSNQSILLIGTGLDIDLVIDLDEMGVVADKPASRNLDPMRLPVGQTYHADPHTVRCRVHPPATLVDKREVDVRAVL